MSFSDTAISSLSTPVGQLLVRVSLVFLVAWLCHWLLSRWNPRWRIVLWRATCVALLGVLLHSTQSPLCTLAILPAENQSIELPLPTARRLEQSLIDKSNVEKQAAEKEGQVKTSARSVGRPPAATAPTPAVLTQAESRPARVDTSHEVALEVAPPLDDIPAPGEADRVSAANWTVWLWAIWAAGALVGIIRFSVGLISLRRMRATSTPAASWIRAEVAALADLLLKGKNIEVLQSTRIQSPSCAGFWKPVIFLPSTQSLSDRREVRAILAHELMHFVGGDLIWNCLLHLISILVWFHPLAWRMRVAHADACDQRCDADAARLLDGAETYGRLLTRVAPRFAGASPATAMPMAHRAEVARRIETLRADLAKPVLLRRRVAAAIAVAAVFTVAMGIVGLGRSLAQPAKQVDEAPTAADDSSQPAEVEAVLSGQILDEAGQPVTDATINLIGKTRKTDGSTEYLTTKTDREGSYAFKSVTQADTYRVRIESTECVGLTNWRELPEVQLSPSSKMTRDFTLKRACLVKLLVVNQQGKPVKGVQVYIASLTSDRHGNSESTSTNAEGMATLGGNAPSEDEYILGTSHKDYGFAKLLMKLDDPTKVYERGIVLSPGVAVKGIAICSDGQPAEGWTVKAMPKWWHYGASPRGMAIDQDGSFTLPHVTPDNYDVFVSIPTGEGMFRQHNALTDVQLPPEGDLLELKLSVPSPKSMGAISGIVKVEGQPLKETIHVYARSEDGEHRGNGSVRVGENKFRISPIPPGRYMLTFSSTEVEQLRLEGVEAPKDDVEVTLKSVGRPRLSGTVLRADSQEPIQHFRIRVRKVGYLRGPNYVQDSNWQAVDDPTGKFSLEVIGPGIYQVIAAAEGLAPVRSDQINTDENDGEPLSLEMTAGVTLSGIITDEEGKPVDGAVITAASYATTPTAANAASPANNNHAVRSVEGRFRLPIIPSGEESLTIEHPDFCSSTTQPFAVNTKDLEVEPITLIEGGTVQGRVYDASGNPEPNVTLYIQDDSGYSGFGDEQAGRLATVVSDKNGDYTADHLPEKLCYVQRGEQWNSLGVVRTAVLPTSGETSQVDLGGPDAATGRLLIDGKPLRKQWVQLGGDNPNFGLYKAYAQTDENGNFAFWGPAPSKRILYYRVPGKRNQWIRAREVTIDPEKPMSALFGEIDVRLVKLIVPVAGLPKDELSKVRVSLQEYSPRWPFGNSVGVLQPRQQHTDPFIFEFLPPGRYEVVCRRADNLTLRKVVDLSTEDSNPQVRMEWPAATGTLEVRLHDALCGPTGCTDPPNLWSTDGRFHANVYPREGTSVRYENLPTGDYYLAKADTRDPPRVLEFSLAPNAEKVLQLSDKNYQPPPHKVGMLVVQCYTPAGIPLEGCKIEMHSDSGSIQENSSQHGRTNLIGDPGEYKMTVSYPGFQPVEQLVNMNPVAPDGRAVGDITIEVRLSR